MNREFKIGQPSAEKSMVLDPENKCKGLNLNSEIRGIPIALFRPPCKKNAFRCSESLILHSMEQHRCS
jgi:hypothetical protein